MCLIVWNWQPGSDTPLLLLSNRDEFYERPCMPLHWWNSAPDTTGPGTILAGRDMQGGGTWLGISRSGRLAALTNFRQAQALRTDAPSRGELVANFLNSTLGAPEFLHQLSTQIEAYNPFNLLVFDGQHLLGLESRGARTIALQPGLGGVSNAGFNTPWPKLLKLQNGLRKELAHGTSLQTGSDTLHRLLHDTARVPDAALPQTGVALELERALSPIFVATPRYGTRACSVVQLKRQRATFVEQTIDATGLPARQVHAAGFALHA